MLGALIAGAIGLGAVALEDLDGSRGGTQASLIAVPDGAAPKSAIEASGFHASAGALADFETPTATATRTSTPTPTSTPTRTPTPSPTATEVPPTPTEEPVIEAFVLPTDTPVPPTETPIPPTETPVPPTVTPVPPTATPTETPTPTIAVPANVPILGIYVSPTPTLTPTAVATATATATQPAPQGPSPNQGTEGLVAGYATRYADSLEGNTMACGGVFDQDNAFVIAVGLQYDKTWPCGTQLEVCGPAGCLSGVRTDTCPGCPGGSIDLSRTGLQIVCGNQDGCNVVTRRAP